MMSLTSINQKKIERELRSIERSVYRTRISQRIDETRARALIREQLIEQRNEHSYTDIEMLIEYLEDGRTIH